MNNEIKNKKKSQKFPSLSFNFSYFSSSSSKSSINTKCVYSFTSNILFTLRMFLFIYKNISCFFFFFFFFFFMLFFSSFFRYLLAFKNILRSIENMGISLTYGISYYGRGQLSTSNYISYVRHESLGSDLLNASLNYALNIKELHAKLIRNLPDYYKIQKR